MRDSAISLIFLGLESLREGARLQIRGVCLKLDGGSWSWSSQHTDSTYTYVIIQGPPRPGECVSHSDDRALEHIFLY
jgi:hypothetical protein